jgi:hypothetical protein
MKRSANELAALSEIELLFAQAEIRVICDRDSVARALEHIAKASQWLLRLDRKLCEKKNEQNAA